MSTTQSATELAESPPRAPNISVGRGGLELKSYEEMKSFSACLGRSGLAPKGLTTWESCLIAVQMGAELGLTPMASVQNIAVINGRPTVYGDTMLALCMGSPAFDHSAFEEFFEGEGDELTAVCVARRTGSSNARTGRFSVADAKRAKLLDKQGPWREYPRRMLMWRARTFVMRDVFADVLCGFSIFEEVGDFVDVEAAPVNGATGKVSRTESLAGRLAGDAADPPADTPADTPKEPEAPQPPNEPEVKDAEPPAPPMPIQMVDMATLHKGEVFVTSGIVRAAKTRDTAKGKVNDVWIYDGATEHKFTWSGSFDDIPHNGSKASVSGYVSGLFKSKPQFAIESFTEPVASGSEAPVDEAGEAGEPVAAGTPYDDIPY